MINDLWNKNAVVYCLSVATFMDANGDGVGDFSGLMHRLDYLQGLGITAIWLMPFQASPCRDDGYDVADYYNVDERFGTLGDFVEFAHAARQRGIRVIIDLVVNHTSNQHAWFKQACTDPDSPYRDWYVWSKKKPRNANKGMVFPGVQKSMGFWIQLGVSGFRMDAVPFVIATKGAAVTKPAEQYDMLRTFREFLQWREGDAIILAEANVLPDTDMEYFGRAGDRMHMMFNDELDLGRLTKPQRDAVFSAFGPDKSMQLYGRGIRRCNGRPNRRRASPRAANPFCPSSATGRSGIPTSTPHNSAAIPTPGSTGWSASSACARKYRKLAGAISNSSPRAIFPCSPFATTGAITPCSSCTTCRQPLAR